MTHSGGKPHTNVGDRGQPYEVTYDDGDGNRKVFGWAETTDGVAQMIDSIELHPTWNSPQWRDRRTGETGPAQSRVSDVYLATSLREISRAKALDSQMISTAFLRMLLVEIIERRAEGRPRPVSDARIDDLLRALAIESSLPELTAMNREAVRAWLGTSDSAGAAPHALRAYNEAMQSSGVPHEPLQVYTSNSWRRVGLVREYKQVMTPIVGRDGHPDIDGKSTLAALVAAFNAMLETRGALASAAKFEQLQRELEETKRWYLDMTEQRDKYARLDCSTTGPLKLDNDRQVFFYEQDHYYLSNFSAFTIVMGGLWFPTSEHAYHFCKFPDFPELQAAIRNAPSAHEAFKLAEREKRSRREDWDEVKVGIMRQILRRKVDQHEYVRRKLLATGGRELIENSWRDDVWGWGPNRDGQNMLGKLWMEIRAELRASAKVTPDAQ